MLKIIIDNPTESSKKLNRSLICKQYQMLYRKLIHVTKNCNEGPEENNFCPKHVRKLVNNS